MYPSVPRSCCHLFPRAGVRGPASRRPGPQIAKAVDIANRSPPPLSHKGWLMGFGRADTRSSGTRQRGIELPEAATCCWCGPPEQESAVSVLAADGNSTWVASPESCPGAVGLGSRSNSARRPAHPPILVTVFRPFQFRIRTSPPGTLTVVIIEPCFFAQLQVGAGQVTSDRSRSDRAEGGAHQKSTRPESVADGCVLDRAQAPAHDARAR